MTITVKELPNGLIEVCILKSGEWTTYEVVCTEDGFTEVEPQAVEDNVDTLIELAVELYLN